MSYHVDKIIIKPYIYLFLFFFCPKRNSSSKTKGLPCSPLLLLFSAMNVCVLESTVEEHTVESHLFSIYLVVKPDARERALN